MLFFNTDAVIADLDQHILFIDLIDAGDNTATGLAILRGILHQVDEHHPDLFLVRKNCNRRFAAFFDGSADIFIMCLDGQGFEDLPDQVLNHEILFV